MRTVDERKPGTRAGWLAPTCLGLALVSWAIPGFGSILAGCAILSGLAALVGARRVGRRVDWMAVVGVCVGGGQVFMSALLLLARTPG